MLTMPSGSAQRLVRIAVSVMLPYHRSLLGSCPLAGGLCPRAHMISRRRLQTPRAAADGTERPAALRYASARWYSARGARPGRLCAPAAARSGLLGSILVHSGTCFQGKATMRVSDAASTASCQHGPHTSACGARVRIPPGARPGELCTPEAPPTAERRSPHAGLGSLATKSCPRDKAAKRVSKWANQPITHGTRTSPPMAPIAHAQAPSSPARPAASPKPIPRPALHGASESDTRAPRASESEALPRPRGAGRAAEGATRAATRAGAGRGPTQCPWAARATVAGCPHHAHGRRKAWPPCAHGRCERKGWQTVVHEENKTKKSFLEPAASGSSI